MLDDFVAEVLFESLLGSVWHAVKACIGSLYLYLRYWQPQQVCAQLAKYYSGRYATAGAAVLRVLLQALAIGLLLALWIAGVLALIF